MLFVLKGKFNFAYSTNMVLSRLIIDIGNTFFKIAIFEGKMIIFQERVAGLEINRLKDILEKYDIKSSIISAVKDYPDEIDTFLISKHYHITLSNFTAVPLNNMYKTPETLGKDRLALAVGAIKKFPRNNVLIIDAGTTITYDIVTQQQKYLGGAISPGITMRFKALNNFTGKLPLITQTKWVDIIGYNTETSIQSGVLHGVIKEIDGVIDEYKSRFDNLKVVVTGGDHIYFVKKLKNSIFATPNLVLEGLNEILIFNESN